MSDGLPERAQLFAVAAAGALLSVPGTIRAQDMGQPTDRAGPVLPRVEVTASTDASTAAIAFQLGNTVSRNDQGGEVRNWRFEQTSLTISTPFNGEDDASPATLDGLANGTKATFRFGSFAGASRLVIASDFETAVQDALAECLRVEASPTDEDNCKKASVDGRQRWLIWTYLPKRARRALVAQVPSGTFEWGFEGSIGYHEFEFLDPTSLAEDNSEKFEVGGKAFFAWYPVSTPLAVTGSVDYQRAFKGQDDAIVCPAGTGGAPVTCVNGALGAPTLDENLLLAGGIRFRLGDSGGALPSFAAAPLVTYDAIDDVVGIDLPVYFLSNEEARLTGGIRAGWRSDTDELTFGIFIGSAFNIFQ